jgi:uncharacterized membrane protein (UPF0127 family)
MKRPSAWLLTLAVVALLVVGGALAVTTGALTGDYERTTVTVVDNDTHVDRAAVDVRIADSPAKRYTGLSATDSLGSEEGMLFVHDSQSRRGYVMRAMAFPIDIVFIDSDGTITTIHHAAVDADQPFHGEGQYVLELPHHYTTDNDIAVGDRVEIPPAYR